MVSRKLIDHDCSLKSASIAVLTAALLAAAPAWAEDSYTKEDSQKETSEKQSRKSEPSNMRIGLLKSVTVSGASAEDSTGAKADRTGGRFGVVGTVSGPNQLFRFDGEFGAQRVSTNATPEAGVIGEQNRTLLGMSVRGGGEIGFSTTVQNDCGIYLTPLRSRLEMNLSTVTNSADDPNVQTPGDAMSFTIGASAGTRCELVPGLNLLVGPVLDQVYAGSVYGGSKGARLGGSIRLIAVDGSTYLDAGYAQTVAGQEDDGEKKVLFLEFDKQVLGPVHLRGGVDFATISNRDTAKDVPDSLLGERVTVIQGNVGAAVAW